MEINREILYEFAKNIVQEYESTKQVKTLEDYEILSIKRLSDGEIFTLGDKVGIITNNYPFNIEKIEIIRGSLYIIGG